MGRPRWLGAGVVVGVAGTVWAERRLKRRAKRVGELASVSGARAAMQRTAHRTGATVKDAVEVARTERSRREEELWRQLGGREEPTRPTPPERLRRA